MNTLMTVGATQNASERMSSRQVAELTGKRHADVMRDIRNMVNQINQSRSASVDCSSDYHRGNRDQYKFLSESTQSAILDFAFGNNDSPYNIELGNYTDAKGEKREMYLLNKKACFLLASGYDVVLRANIIDRWEELEQANKPTMPQTYLEALKALVASEENRLLLQEENKLQQQIIHEYEPKVSYYDSILQSTDAINITVIAKDYGISAKKLNEILHELKIQYKQSTTWLLYQDHSIYGYTKTTTTKYNKPNGEVGTNVHTKWTQKGRLFLYQQLKAYGLIPVIERQN